MAAPAVPVAPRIPDQLARAHDGPPARVRERAVG